MVLLEKVETVLGVSLSPKISVTIESEASKFGGISMTSLSKPKELVSSPLLN